MDASADNSGLCGFVGVVAICISTTAFSVSFGSANLLSVSSPADGDVLIGMDDACAGDLDEVDAGVDVGATAAVVGVADDVDGGAGDVVNAGSAFGLSAFSLMKSMCHCKTNQEIKSHVSSGDTVTNTIIQKSNRPSHYV